MDTFRGEQGQVVHRSQRHSEGRCHRRIKSNQDNRALTSSPPNAASISGRFIRRKSIKMKGVLAKWVHFVGNKAKLFTEVNGILKVVVTEE